LTLDFLDVYFLPITHWFRGEIEALLPEILGAEKWVFQVEKKAFNSI
jgi:hypothetical protein